MLKNVFGYFLILDWELLTFEKKIERNSALNYFSVTKIHMKKLYLNVKKHFSTTLWNSHFKEEKGGGGISLVSKNSYFHA